METDYDVLGLAALPNDDELLPQIFAPNFMHILGEADLFDEVPVVDQSTSLNVHPATSAAACGGHTRPQISLMSMHGGTSDAATQQQQQLGGDLLLVTQQRQEHGMLLFDQQLYHAAPASSVGDGGSAAGSPVHSVPGSPISSRPASSSATTALTFEHQRSSSQASPSAADDDTKTAVSAAIHLLQQQHQQQLQRSSQQHQWHQQQSPAGSQAFLQQEEKPLTKAQLAALKRKAPEVNWRSIQVGCSLHTVYTVWGIAPCSPLPDACKKFMQRACRHVVMLPTFHAACLQACSLACRHLIAWPLFQLYGWCCWLVLAWVAQFHALHHVTQVMSRLLCAIYDSAGP
jgi:hypothetical protein